MPRTLPPRKKPLPTRDDVLKKIRDVGVDPNEILKRVKDIYSDRGKGEKRIGREVQERHDRRIRALEVLMKRAADLRPRIACAQADDAASDDVERALDKMFADVEWALEMQWISTIFFAPFSPGARGAAIPQNLGGISRYLEDKARVTQLEFAVFLLQAESSPNYRKRVKKTWDVIRKSVERLPQRNSERPGLLIQAKRFPEKAGPIRAGASGSAIDGLSLCTETTPRTPQPRAKRFRPDFADGAGKPDSWIPLPRKR